MELELKFALSAHDLQQLGRQLPRLALTGRRRPTRQTLHNSYFDTPEHRLHDQRVALRLRQLGSPSQPHWVQTLKVGGAASSAFSQRGEWETAVDAAQLSYAALGQTPWAQIDPTGALFGTLLPVFTTTFERLSWTIELGDAAVELALDQGSVRIDGRSTALCELEIELLRGPPQALFEVAAAISQRVCLLPLHISKAERAYRLAQGTLQAPLRARAPEVHKKMDGAALAQSVLRSCFLQFSANLYTLRSSEAPEVLHQARVGWRRFKSARTLFRQQDVDGCQQALDALQPLLLQMALVRDLDVMACEWLPVLASAYQAPGPQQAAHWQQLQAALEQDTQAQRALLLQQLAEPAVGRALLQITQWLELGTLMLPPALGPAYAPTPARWLDRRLNKLAMEMQALQLQARAAQDVHRLRLLAKRLRYGVEDLRPLLPKKRAERWLRSATQLQAQVGRERDLQQAIANAQRLHAHSELVGFLRGAAWAFPAHGASPAAGLA